MVSSRTILKIVIVIAALIITSTVLAITPVEAKSQSIQWTWHGSSSANAGYPVLSPTGDLYTYSTIGGRATVYSISPEGKDLWNTSLVLASMPQFSADGNIYILEWISNNTSVNGTGLLVLTPEGAVKWTFTVPGLAEGMKILPDGGVVLGTEPFYPGQHSLICLNINGSVRWTKGSYDTNSTNPMMLPVGIHGNDILVASTSFESPSNSVITEYAPDGTVVRSFRTDFTPLSISFALDGTMRAVGYNFSQSTDYEYLYAMNDNGSVMWALMLGNEAGNLVVLSDGTTIFGESTNSSVLNLNVYAVDAMGNTLWKSANVMSIPVAFGTGVLFANSTALMLVDRDGGVLWKLDGSFSGMPVVNGKTIYAGSGNDLLAISESTWKVTWQPVVILFTIMFAAIGVGLLGGRSFTRD